MNDAHSNDGPPVVVIGAGAVGIACACFLQQDGRQVLVLDPGGPGEGASFGNAGGLNGSSVVPVAMPGVLPQVPRWLLDPLGPLAIRWRYLPFLLPWLWRFVRAGTPEKVKHQAKALRGLLAPSVDAYRALLRPAGAEDVLHRVGHLNVYKSRASFDKDSAAMELRRANGVDVLDVSSDELHQLEPALSRDYVLGRLISENGHCSNPLRMMQALAEHLVRNGGRIERARALGFVGANGRVDAVRSDAGDRPASHVVIAAGAWSRPLARALGDRLPLDTERGYHVTIKDPEVMPRLPAMAAEGKFAVTPMEMGLRVAGTVEFGGLDAPPNWRRARILLSQAQAMYPGLSRQIGEDRIATWMGFRPSMPDSLPVISPSGAFANAFYAFGHGHIGLAAAPMTGRLVADLIAGRAPCLDPTPFSAKRFDGNAA
jgi:D-amino-acid dehydrogenase